MNFLENALTAERILNLAFHSLIVLFIGWLFAQLFRHKVAPLRSGISLMTMLTLMLLPFLSISSPSLNLTSIETTLPFKVTPSSPKIEVQGRGHLAQTEESPGVLTSSPLSENNAQSEKRSLFGISFSARTMIKIINGFGMVWALGFLFLLVRFLFGVASLRKFKDGLIEIHGGRTTKILEATEKAFGRRVRAKVFTSRKIQGVFAMGLFKPLIIIPQDLFITLSESEIKGILLHELSHIFHRDQMTGILQRIVAALNWWNPFVYALSSDLSRVREEISDNHVLLENNSKEYAECLINLTEKTSLISRVPVFTAMASPHIPLKKRVKHILSKERIMETKLKKSTILVIVMISIFLISGIAGYRLTFASAESKNSPEAAAKEMPIPQEKKRTILKEKSSDKKIVPPKLIKKVDPVYPEEAHEADIEGRVVLEATTDHEGIVTKIKIIEGKHEILNRAAVDAVMQWKYEPMLINGKPRGVIFTVTCRFKLEKGKPDVSIESGVGKAQESPVRAVKDIKPPKLIKKVAPVYPEVARQAKVEGVVILEVTADIYGQVQRLKVLRSIPLLDRAAIDAVKQWIYEPMVVKGIPRTVIFTVTVPFRLDEEKPDVSVASGVDKDQETPIRAFGDIKPPKLIKKVAPVHPEMARQAKVEGVVILEVTTDIYGRVQKVKVLRSIPLLDKAAIDAVKRWIYEPTVINGKPRGVIFVVTCPFRLEEKDNPQNIT